LIDWNPLLLPAAILLTIPLTIVIGYRRTLGSIVMSGALAAVAFAAFWLVLGGPGGFFGDSASVLIKTVLLIGGASLALAAWILSLNAAAQARRWVWVGLLLVSGYFSLAAIYASFSVQPCFGVLDGGFACPPPDTLRQALEFVGYLACPLAALIFSVRATGRRVRTPPDGMTVPSLHARTPEDATTSSPASDGS
jgi:hypothetical protein